MKKIFKYLLSIIVILPSFLLNNSCSCTRKNEQGIQTSGESKMIQTTKKVSDFKEDYKSISFAYLNNLKNNLNTYRYDVTGTIEAKVLFINYKINFDSYTIKNGNYYYAREHSTSTFQNVDSIFYSDNQKMAYSKNLKDYKVVTLEDYHKVSTSPEQALLLGYLFDEQSIINATLENKDDDTYTFKYVLDNDSSTPYVKKTMKETGDLVDYPTFNDINIYLTMKNDFTPVKIVLDTVYQASKPIIGSGTCTQHQEVVFSSINQNVTIENESYYKDLLGSKETDSIEQDNKPDVKNDLLRSLDKLPWTEGVKFTGSIYTDVSKYEDAGEIHFPAISIDINALAELEKIKEEDLFNFAKLYVNIEGNDLFNTIISIVNSLASEKLGDYANLLSKFKGANIYYTGDGNIYIAAYDESDLYYDLEIFDLGNILTGLLHKINIYNLLTNNESILDYEKETVDDHNEKISISLSDNTKEKIKNGIESFIDEQPLVNMIVSYKSFNDLAIDIVLRDEMFESINVVLTYNNNDDEIAKLAAFELERQDNDYNYEDVSDVYDIESLQNQAKLFNDKVMSVMDNLVFAEPYKNRIDNILAEYELLDDDLKPFITDKINKLSSLKTAIDLGLSIYDKISIIDEISNKDIYNLILDIKRNKYEAQLKELCADKYSIIEHIENYVDTTDFEAAIANIDDFEKSIDEWGWTLQDVEDYRVLFYIANNNEPFKQVLQSILTDNYDNVYQKLRYYN